jgi:hypothetical protein
MNNEEKNLTIEKQLKLAKIFKAVISAGLIAPVFIPTSAYGKKHLQLKK